jgi:integrating conjugative element protein (TIGR03757 family)
MIRNTHSIRFVVPVSIVLVLLACSVVQADQNSAGYPCHVEVFTTTDLPVTGEANISQQPGCSGIETQIYDLGGIQHIEARLSKDLTADHAQSKQVVLRRIQKLNKADSARMQHAAIGLAKAMQYGIDRYPAIVFDGKTVVYGVTDIGNALHLYRQWREGQKQ